MKFLTFKSYYDMCRAISICIPASYFIKMCWSLLICNLHLCMWYVILLISHIISNNINLCGFVLFRFNFFLSYLLPGCFIQKESNTLLVSPVSLNTFTWSYISDTFVNTINKSILLELSTQSLLYYENSSSHAILYAVFTLFYPHLKSKESFLS